MKNWKGLVFLTSDEMSQVDRTAVELFGMDVLMLMENAGAATALLAKRVLRGADGKSIVCLVGKGNNGGDGLVAARHLWNWGAEVRVMLGCSKDNMREVPARQLAIIERMGIPVVGPGQDLGRADLVIDALLGYNPEGNPKGPVAELIWKANGSGAPVLAVDLPSGLHATSGRPGTPCIKAEATATFGFPKAGFLVPAARRLVGRLYLVDISLPGELYSEYSESHRIFAKGNLLRIF